MNPMDRACPYSQNPFCSQLNIVDRNQLCSNCHPFSFRKKDSEKEKRKEIIREMATDHTSYCTLILKGCICTSKSSSSTNRHALTLWEAGDIMHAQMIFGDGDSFHELYRYHFISDGYCAIFDAGTLKQMFLHSVTFSTALFLSVTKTQERQMQFLLGAQLQNAREAILFVLVYGKQNHYPPLTHREMAYLCGLDRTTVTKTLKKIMQEDDLDITLHDCLAKIYNKE